MFTVQYMKIIQIVICTDDKRKSYPCNYATCWCKRNISNLDYLIHLYSVFEISSVYGNALCCNGTRIRK